MSERRLDGRWLIIGLLTSFLIACGALTDSRATTAKEFVEKYSEAHKIGNVSAILKLTELEQGETESSFKEEIKKDLNSHGFGYMAWSKTHYVSEEDHGTYIRVDVRVDYARSSIVLVKRDGFLKIAQNPSKYEQ